jgi:hypothetical protein
MLDVAIIICSPWPYDMCCSFFFMSELATAPPFFYLSRKHQGLQESCTGVRWSEIWAIQAGCRWLYHGRDHPVCREVLWEDQRTRELSRRIDITSTHPRILKPADPAPHPWSRHTTSCVSWLQRPPRQRPLATCCQQPPCLHQLSFPRKSLKSATKQVFCSCSLPLVEVCNQTNVMQLLFAVGWSSRLHTFRKNSCIHKIYYIESLLRILVIFYQTCATVYIQQIIPGGKQTNPHVSTNLIMATTRLTTQETPILDKF